MPGSRRLRKRPRLKKRKEARLQTLKDLTSLIMEYKKNEVITVLVAASILICSHIVSRY